DLDGAHSATADTRATYEVLKAQLDRYPSLQNSIEFLSQFSTQKRSADLAGRIVFDEQGHEIFNFGKHKGRSVEEVFRKEPGYYGWMMNGDFAANTKQVITRIYTRMRQQ
ncbi:MAG: 3'-5' exonuclease, partial [Muribaculaceae bacterium]|nr:3'-5' exonuclease [Muribaculaceae bacterium]